MLSMWSACGALFVVAGCLEVRNPKYCGSDSDCKDPEKPFCDVNGEFEESGFQDHACTSRPTDCSIERCGCTANAPLSCDGDQLVTCGGDGRSTTTTTCALGCSADALPRCSTFEPTNGLGSALVEAVSEADVTIPTGSVIDTSGGGIVDSSGISIPVRSVVVEQGMTKIRVFIARSFVIEGATVRGSHAFAAVAAESISLTGLFDAAAAGPVAGPGAVPAGHTCRGENTSFLACGANDCSNGAGGGGNATAGGGGGYAGTSLPSGGAAQSGGTPLVGGCEGGDQLQGPNILNEGGGGGGAVQFVAGRQIQLSERGLVNVAGGGGQPTAGGGSAGLVVMEAPTIRIDGGMAGVVANGGAGGACGRVGSDGGVTTSRAIAPANCTYSGGDGGTGLVAATDAARCITACFNVQEARGAGGGAAGRARFASRDGTVTSVSNPLLSAVVVNETLAPR